MEEMAVVLMNAREGHAASRIRGGIEGALPDIREGRTGDPIDRYLVRRRAGAGSLYRAGREQKLADLGGTVIFCAEQPERRAFRVEVPHTVEPRAVVQGQPPRDLPGVLPEPLDLSVAGMVHQLRVVVAVSKNAADQRIRVRISGVESGGPVGAEIVGSRGVVKRVHAHVARHALEVYAGFHTVRTLNPGDLITEGLDHVGPCEGPAGVVAKLGGVSDGQAG